MKWVKNSDILNFIQGIFFDFLKDQNKISNSCSQICVKCKCVNKLTEVLYVGKNAY